MIDIHAKAHVKNALRKLRKHPTDATPDEHHHCLKQRIAFYRDNFRLGVKSLTDRNNKDRLACGRFYHGLRGAVRVTRQDRAYQTIRF